MGLNGEGRSHRCGKKKLAFARIRTGTAVSPSSLPAERSVTTIHKKSVMWPELSVAMKISRVDGRQISGKEPTDKAVEKGGNPEHGWTPNYLPWFSYVEDVEDPTQGSIQELCKTGTFGNGKYAYEEGYVSP